jgi:hypothetical protein
MEHHSLLSSVDIRPVSKQGWADSLANEKEDAL